jgi:hypothetical protein
MSELNKLMAGYFQLIYSYMLLFPQFALTAYSHLLTVSTYLSKLSPKAQQVVIKTFLFLQSIVVAVYSLVKRAYPVVMAFGTRELHQWNQPHKFILLPVAKVTSFFFPVELDWKDTSEGSIYVGNANVLGLDCNLY